MILKSVVRLLAAGLPLVLGPGLTAAVVQTDLGGIEITDSSAGLDFDIDGDGQQDINVAYFGVSVNGTFGFGSVVRSATGVGARVKGSTDRVSQTFPPITEPRPTTVSPPRIVALG